MKVYSSLHVLRKKAENHQLQYSGIIANLQFPQKNIKTKHVIIGDNIFTAYLSVKKKLVKHR